jgi:DNA replication licensing factor MCM4
MPLMEIELLGQDRLSAVSIPTFGKLFIALQSEIARLIPIKDSSPVNYASSSSPTHAAAATNELRTEIPSSSSGLFFRSSRSVPGSSAQNISRRGDIHSELLGSTPNRPRRLFVNENGETVHDSVSDAPTFSRHDHTTSDAPAAGSNSIRMIWGTNVSMQDSMSSFRNFLTNFKRKYRMWADGAEESDTTHAGDIADELQYVNMMRNMRLLGVTSLNLDARDLKSYPPTNKFWHQMQAYPQEIIPIMDQTIKDVMVEQVTEELQKRRARQIQTRAQVDASSSQPAIPSSERNYTTIENEQRADNQKESDLLADVEARTYKVRIFGLDSTVNLRDLNPAG